MKRFLFLLGCACLALVFVPDVHAQTVNKRGAIILQTSDGVVISDSNPLPAKTYASQGTVKTINNALFTVSTVAAFTVPAGALVTFAKSWSASSTNALLLCFTSTCGPTTAFSVLKQYEVMDLSYLTPTTTIWARTDGASGTGFFWSISP